jgi:hypothetical protein
VSERATESVCVGGGECVCATQSSGEGCGSVHVCARASVSELK